MTVMNFLDDIVASSTLLPTGYWVYTSLSLLFFPCSLGPSLKPTRTPARLPHSIHHSPNRRTRPSLSPRIPPNSRFHRHNRIELFFQVAQDLFKLSLVVNGIAKSGCIDDGQGDADAILFELDFVRCDGEGGEKVSRFGERRLGVREEASLA